MDSGNLRECLNLGLSGLFSCRRQGQPRPLAPAKWKGGRPASPDVPFLTPTSLSKEKPRPGREIRGGAWVVTGGMAPTPVKRGARNLYPLPLTWTLQARSHRILSPGLPPMRNEATGTGRACRGRLRDDRERRVRCHDPASSLPTQWAPRAGTISTSCH